MEGGHTEFKKLHTIGYDGWTISKYRQFGGETPDGEPEHIIRDMNLDGVDATHVRIALTNGLTEDELAEVIYHATGYAGFPRAVAARTAAREALGR